MSLGVHFDNCGSLLSPVPGLLLSLVIYAKLIQEGLDITLVLDVQNSSLEVFSEGLVIVAFYLAWCLSSSSDSL